MVSSSSSFPSSSSILMLVFYIYWKVSEVPKQDNNLSFVRNFEFFCANVTIFSGVEEGEKRKRRASTVSN